MCMDIISNTRQVVHMYYADVALGSSGGGGGGGVFVCFQVFNSLRATLRWVDHTPPDQEVVTPFLFFGLVYFIHTFIM